jgi:hypothetical protein
VSKLAVSARLTFPAVDLASGTAGVPGPEASGFIKCADGEKILGGAANVSDAPESELLISRPATNNTGAGGYPTDGQAFTFWKATARNLNNTTTTDVRIFAICMQTQ